MFNRVLLLIPVLYISSACSTVQYIEPPEFSKAMPQASEGIQLKPVSTFVPVKAKDLPVYIDPLTGLSTKEPVVNSRPVAVVINNHSKARPQSGISQAAICYEVLAEGNITRIIAIFHDFDAQKIGPVRSARHYFVDFALDYDAIFVHHGGSPQGYDAIEKSGIACLDGMKLSDTFWRDPERVYIPGMFEHSSYTGEALIRQAQERFGFRPEIREGLNPGFLFYNEPASPDGAAGAMLINIPFAEDYGSTFEFREGMYYKSINDEPQIDAETGEQLSVANVLVQFAQVTSIAGDDAGRRDVSVIGWGNGVLITNGCSAPLTWNKDTPETPTRWLNEDGSDLYLNKGKTWICVVSPEIAVSIE